MKSESERLTIIRSLLKDTIHGANDTFATENRTLFNSYNQEFYGNEEEGRSQVIASDHFDMVESDMPALARIFLGANKVLEFKPFGADDAEEARQKTLYADYLIREQRESFKTLIDWLKEPGMAQTSVVKFWCETKEAAKYVKYAGLSEDEVTAVIDELSQDDDVDRVEIESKDEDDDGNLAGIRFRIVSKVKRVRIAGVPVNSFIITRGAKSKDEATLIGDVCYKRKYELIQDGLDESLVKSLPVTTDSNTGQDNRYRLREQGGWDERTGYHWLNDEVLIEHLYPLLDSDDDGIPERRFIMKCGEKIISDEPYGIAPYAMLSQITIPHSAIGKSRGEQAARYQKEKTAIKRGIMDNIYSVNRPGHAVDGSSGVFGGSKIDIDEMLSQQISRLVRVDGNPHESIMPLETPYIGDKALQVVQYIDNEKANTLGAMMSNQGLSADKFYRETATRFEGVSDASEAKIELVARVYAETGWRELYEGVIWTAQHYQDEETEIMVLGKPLKMDPRSWRREHYCKSCIGLGAGDSADAIENLSVMLNTQFQMMSSGLPIVDAKKLYNTLDDIVRAMGKPDVSRYFNDPEVPESMLQAMLEQAQKQLAVLQQQVSQNPLAEAELIRAQAKMAEVQGKESNSMRQFIIEMAQKDSQFAQQLAKDLTELELKYSKNVPGALV